MIEQRIHYPLLYWCGYLCVYIRFRIAARGAGGQEILEKGPIVGVTIRRALTPKYTIFRISLERILKNQAWN